MEPLLDRYDPNNVFNANEMGFHWRFIPDKTHAVRGETCTGDKKSKERITLLVCAVTGNEKCPNNRHLLQTFSENCLIFLFCTYILNYM